MDLDRDTSNTDECLVTALQIFDYCGAESTGSLHVDALMDKCAPSVKTNNAEFSYLKSLLDPNQSNPEINVSKLASALSMFSEGQKSKLDLDESFNLKSGQGPLDSDSGISNDGFLILEELQSELREKTHLAAQLRSQLDFTDRQHEEALAALTAERDSLKAHLTILRDENQSLTHVRRDYEEACERLCGSEHALGTARRERDAARRRAATLQEQVASLDAEKLTLQELLTKSKDECHRINEMYASRQSSLLEQTELMRSERAELRARLRDQDDALQQALREKVIVEMELKDVLNRSNQTQLRLDRSIDVSYTEDQMLTALDTLNTDTRFSSDNQVLDEEAFVKQLRDQNPGRASNLSLFDEIRLSFCNVSKLDIPDSFCNLSRSQLLDLNDTQCDKCSSQLDLYTTAIGTQTDEGSDNDNVECEDCVKICIECVKLKETLMKLQSDLTLSNDKLSIMQTEQKQHEDNLNVMQKCVDRFNVVTVATETQTVDEPAEICNDCIEKALKCNALKDINVNLNIELKNTQLTLFNMETELTKYQANLDTLQNYIDSLKVDNIVVGTQTDASDISPSVNNNNVDSCNECTKICVECDRLKDYTAKLENDVVHANSQVSKIQLDLDKYENTLDVLQKYVNEGIDRNNFLETMSDNLQEKLQILESACAEHKEKVEFMACESCSAQSQTDDSDLASVSTQVEVPCIECEKRNAVVPHRNLRRLFWEPLKCLFQAFAVLCFICAISVLYGVTRRAARCERDAVPWRWIDAQEFMDMLLRIEYVAEVPM